MNKKSFFSREIAAGYYPEIMEAATVLIVGTGVLGQAIAMILALSQIGRLLLVDNDVWESHNATRSPLFPTSSELSRWGNAKVVGVANKLAQMTSWSDKPRIFYAPKPIQALGEGPFRKASLVISAVDNQTARNHLGRLTAEYCKPLVEGGFHAERANSTVLLNKHGDDLPQPCWHCGQGGTRDRQKAVQLGCTSVALETEEAGFIPAIQSCGSFLAAVNAEAAIQILHGNVEHIGNRRSFLNVREPGESMSARLSDDSNCDNHPERRSATTSVEASPDMLCRELVDAVGRVLPDPAIVLPHRFVVRAGCADCKRPIAVNQPEWAWSQGLLFCESCGGNYEHTEGAGNEIYSKLSAGADALLDLSLEQVGLAPNSLVQINTDSAEVYAELSGDADLPFFSEVERRSLR